jgi:lipid-A-disaccharide synthase
MGASANILKREAQETLTARQRTIFFVVGDPSGDKHAAKVIEKLHQLDPELHFAGIGGERMKEQGMEVMYNCNEFAAIGLDVFSNLKFYTDMIEHTLKEIERRNPDLLLLVDCGGMNLRILGRIRKMMPSLPIYYFISPQVWGSRPWRITKIKRNITKMLVIFPFEEELYKKHGVPVTFVGHPLTKNMPASEDLPPRSEFCKVYGLKNENPIVAIFPGSRKQEVKDILPISISAMRWLLRKRPDLQFAIAQASDSLSPIITELIHKEHAQDLLGKNLFLCAKDQNYELLNICDLVWAKSGTTTLEATFFGKPMLIYYRALWASYLIFALFKIVKRVGWPNLLAGYDLVPELIQLDCRAEQLVRYTEDLLDVPELRREVSQKLLSLKQQLGERDYATEVAGEIQKALPAALV